MIAAGYKANFETLVRAVKAKHTCLLECTDATTGKPVITVCAIQREADGQLVMVPLAKMFDGDPYEELIPPEMSDAGVPA